MPPTGGGGKRRKIAGMQPPVSKKLWCLLWGDVKGKKTAGRNWPPCPFAGKGKGSSITKEEEQHPTREGKELGKKGTIHQAISPWGLQKRTLLP